MTFIELAKLAQDKQLKIKQVVIRTHDKKGNKVNNQSMYFAILDTDKNITRNDYNRLRDMGAIEVK
jgi:hypothetical protein